MAEETTDIPVPGGGTLRVPTDQVEKIQIVNLRPSHQAPTVGRVVHYVSYGTPGGEFTSQCRAAIVTEAGGWATLSGSDPKTDYYKHDDGSTRRVLEQKWDPMRMSLHVMNPTGTFDNLSCPFGPDSRAAYGEPVAYPGGSWHWPEQV